MLKLLGRACRPFRFLNAQEINLHNCTRSILGLHKKEKKNLCSKQNKFFILFILESPVQSLFVIVFLGKKSL